MKMVFKSKEYDEGEVEEFFKKWKVTTVAHFSREFKVSRSAAENYLVSQYFDGILDMVNLPSGKYVTTIFIYKGRGRV